MAKASLAEQINFNNINNHKKVNKSKKDTFLKRLLEKLSLDPTKSKAYKHMIKDNEKKEKIKNMNYDKDHKHKYDWIR